MSGKRIAGHERTAVPLSPVRPRQSPTKGWRMDCKCGWSAGPFPRRSEAEFAYSKHITSALPICAGCGESKPRSSMSKGSPHRCKPCARVALREWVTANPSQYERSKRKSHLRKKYGITIEQYEQILLDQGSVCAICKEPPNDPRGFRPHIDHCHSTGVVRGILCGPCNKGLGSLRDSLLILNNAINYLSKYKPKELS